MSSRIFSFKCMHNPYFCYPTVQYLVSFYDRPSPEVESIAIGSLSKVPEPPHWNWNLAASGINAGFITWNHATQLATITLGIN